MIVMKFGGSSVGAPDRIARVIAIVRGRLAREPVIVVSAFRGVTDDLLELGREALDGNVGRLDAVAKAAAELELEFETTVERGMSVVCAVGDAIQSTPGVAAEIFGAMKTSGVNVRMISQGASKNNVAFVVEDKDVETAVKALHARFFPI